MLREEDAHQTAGGEIGPDHPEGLTHSLVAGRLRRLADRLLDYLVSRVDPTGHLPGTEHYGPAFLALALVRRGEEEHNPHVEALLRAEAAQDPKDIGYHHEFNHVAVLLLERLAKGWVSTEHLARARLHGGTDVLNWRLLRVLQQVLLGAPEDRVRGLLAGALRGRIGNDGALHDRPPGFSAQYHVFSAFVLGLIDDACPGAGAAGVCDTAEAQAAVMVLPNGRAILTGRGQEQIFGYGALCAVLARSVVRTGCPNRLAALARVVGLIERYVRENGSMPLVLMGREPPDACSETQPPGWFRYNTLWDYLPLAAFALQEAALRLESVSPGCGGAPSTGSVVDPPAGIRITSAGPVVAVWAAPRGLGAEFYDELAWPQLHDGLGLLTPGVTGEPDWVEGDSEDLCPLPRARFLRTAPLWFRVGRGLRLMREFGIRYRWRNPLAWLRCADLSWLARLDMDWRSLADGFEGTCRWLKFRRVFSVDRLGCRSRDEWQFTRPCPFKEVELARILLPEGLRPSGEPFRPEGCSVRVRAASSVPLEEGSVYRLPAGRFVVWTHRVPVTSETSRLSWEFALEWLID